MYNEGQKQRYLEVLENKGFLQQKRQFISFCNVCEPIEAKFNKDLSLFNYDEVVDLYTFLGYSSIQSYTVFQSNMSNYVRWCISEGLVPDVQNRYTLKYDILQNFLDKNVKAMRVISRQYLLKSIATLMNARDACFLLSLFEFGSGKKHQDIISMRLMDVDTERHLLKLQTRTVKVSPEWISYAEDADSQIYLYDYPKKGQLQEEMKKHEVRTSEFIYKEPDFIRVGCRNSSQDAYGVTKLMNQRFRSIARYLGFPREVNERSIIDSGRIHFIKENAASLGITPTEYLLSNEKEIVNQFGVTLLKYNFAIEFKDYLS